MSEYARVTEVLKPFTDFHKVPPVILENAATRGTKVHALCAGIANGAWIPLDTICDTLRGYVQSFIKWKDAQVKSFEIVETRYVDVDRGYTGMVDFVIRGNDDQQYLVDIKTSSRPQKSYSLQMAAYRLLLRLQGIVPRASMLVYLSKEGEFPEIDYKEETEPETTVFLAALTCFKYFHRKKKKNGKSSDGDATEDVATENERDNAGIELCAEGL